MFIRRLRRRSVVIALVLLLIATAAVVTYVVWPRGTDFQKAVRMLPEDSQRITWTDWAAVRDELDVGDVSGSDQRAADFLAEVQDRELATSSLASSALLLADGLGFSPFAAEWEAFGQGPTGQVVIIKTDQSFSRITDRILELGYARPGKDALSGGVWAGGPDAVAEVPGLTTYELQNLAFFEDEGLIIGSDSTPFLEKMVKTVRGDQDGLDADDLIGASGEPLTATALIGDRACSELAMSSADEAAQATAADLVEQAGGVSPLTGYVVALGADDGLTVVFDFEEEDQAERNRRSRSALAKAEDPAQFVAYPEVFDFGSAEQDGTRVVLTGKVQPDSFPMSSLSTGPVLLAAC